VFCRRQCRLRQVDRRRLVASGNGLCIRAKRYSMLVDTAWSNAHLSRPPGKVEVSGGGYLLWPL